jgi:hypothetical protein
MLQTQVVESMATLSWVPALKICVALFRKIDLLHFFEGCLYYPFVSIPFDIFGRSMHIGGFWMGCANAISFVLMPGEAR